MKGIESFLKSLVFALLCAILAPLAVLMVRILLFCFSPEFDEFLRVLNDIL